MIQFFFNFACYLFNHVRIDASMLSVKRLRDGSTTKRTIMVFSLPYKTDGYRSDSYAVGLFPLLNIHAQCFICYYHHQYPVPIENEKFISGFTELKEYPDYCFKEFFWNSRK